MRYRKLRIAWSVFWGLGAVLLIVLWVRSCWRCDQIMHHSSATELVALTSFRGQVAFSESNDPDLSKIFQRNWLYLGFPLTGNESKTGSPFAVYPASIPKSVILLRPQFNSPSYLVQNGS